MNSFTRRPAFLAGVLMIVLAGLVLSACGGSDSSSSSTGEPNGTDRAFATEMVDHHQMAIDMATVAQDRATRPQIKALANNIITAQKQEIAQLKAADQKLAANDVLAGDLGLSDAMMGMNMDNSMLMTAKPFERMFIDMMVPHHQGAIRMARAELAKGQDPQLRKLAQGVIAAQSDEIEQMNSWRMDWYGAASPSGGVPAADEGMDAQMEGHGTDHGM